MNMKFSHLLRLLAVTYGLLIEGCSGDHKNVDSKQSINDSVIVFTLKKVQVNKQITFPAELIPLKRAEIFAKVSGYINEFRVDIGDHVTAGDLLTTLDAPEIISNFAQVNSEAQTAYSKYQTSLDNYSRLLKASKVSGTIAPGELERSKNQMLADSSASDASKSKLKAAEQLKDYLKIHAPFGGMITQRNFDPGTLVGANTSRPLLILEDISLLRLRVPVPEEYTLAIPRTPVIQFTVDAQPGKIFTATLSRRSGSISLSDRSEIWEYIFQNSDNLLKSGMFATATIEFSRKDLSFLVPSSSVVTNLEKRFVIRVKDNKADIVDVKSAISVDDMTEIYGKLEEGDLLVTRATDEIKPGAKLIIKIKNN
jgi:membrane fusion protein, multidrug efflux system